jgi:hypothetical protein
MQGEPAAYAKKFSRKYEHRWSRSALGTTCRKKHRRHSRKRLLTWLHFELNELIKKAHLKSWEDFDV